VKKAAFLWVFLVTAPAWAAEEQGITAYPASFFADARPATAYDMITRLPGFSLDNSTTLVRGFAGSAGNILVNGARPTAKNDDLFTILGRIPAASVERIELIRGGAPGIDMQGQSVVANIIRKQEDTNQTIVNANLGFLGSGQWVPYGGIEYHGQSGAWRYEASLTRVTQVWNDGPGNGYRIVTAPGQAPVYDRAVLTGIIRTGWAAHGGLVAPLFGGEWDNNFTLQTTDFPGGTRYYGGGGSRFDSITREKTAEFGSHWQGNLGAVNLETLILQRLGDRDDSNTSAAVGSSAIFLASKDTGETIGRITARYSFSPELSLEAGGEGVYNFLEGSSSFVSNGTAVILPNANLSVNEKRGEAFGTATWKIMPSLTLEAGMRAEFSEISSTGDTVNTRDFFYPKPRLLLSWSPDDQSQIRLRAERVLGQLNFSDFVASSNLSGYGVAAGNADLRPEQRWQFEAAFERRFWDRGALVFSYLHEEITDLQDFIPVGNGLDAPGNVPYATSEKLAITGLVPLDFLGLEKAQFKPNLYWTMSDLVDPVTGEHRRISNQRNINSYYEITQDIDSLKSTWGINWGTSFARTTWRISQISRVAIHNSPFLNAFWSYKPTPDWKITFSAENFTPYRLQLDQFNYPGPRNLGGQPTVQNVYIRTQPRFYIQVRKTF
jgi:outer membrane receptor protein involved in Fe transport